MEMGLKGKVAAITGATEGIASALLGLLNPGDEVLVFSPYFPTDPPNIARALAGETGGNRSFRCEGWRCEDHTHQVASLGSNALVSVTRLASLLINV